MPKNIIFIDTENIGFCDGQQESKDSVSPPRCLSSSLEGRELLPYMIMVINTMLRHFMEEQWLNKLEFFCPFG